MLSYLHHFHAGNHADVLKHWLLLECVHYLQKKPAPFEYIDTHSGAGMYRTNSAEAMKTGEISNGILKLDPKAFPELEYLWEEVLPDIDKKQYPGSPKLVQRLLRDGDKAWLYEMHPRVIKELKENCEVRRQCYVKQEDGFKGLLSVLPAKTGRALVLIDPSYEVKKDYETVVDIVAKAHKKMAQATIAIWYPVVNRSTISYMENSIRKSGIKNAHLFEIGVADDEDKGMTSSGMMIVNPPWTLAEKFEGVSERLSAALSEDGVSRARYLRLTAE